MVVNKEAESYFNTPYAVGNTDSSLSLTPFNVTGTVNDGKDIPTVYLDAQAVEEFLPNMWQVQNASVYWHLTKGLTTNQMYSSLDDILQDDTRASNLWEYSWMKEWLNSYSTDSARAEKALEELEKAFDMPYMGTDRCDDATRNYLRENIDKAKLGDPSGFRECIELNYE